MMTYCEGSKCKLANKCEKHCKIGRFPNVEFEYIDWSRMGSGSYTDNSCVIEHTCGDDSKDYPLFEEAIKPKEVQNLEFALSRFGVNLFDENDNRRSNDQVLADVLIKIHSSFLEGN